MLNYQQWPFINEVDFSQRITFVTAAPVTGSSYAKIAPLVGVPGNRQPQGFIAFLCDLCERSALWCELFCFCLWLLFRISHLRINASTHQRINATSTFIPVKIAHDFPIYLRIPVNAKKIHININDLILEK
jgi:hypothetical protein